MRAVVQVVTTIGDSIIDVAFVDDADGAPRTITDAPVRTRTGISEVTLTRVARPTRCVPRASHDRRPVAYIALSLAAHLCLWSVSGGYDTPGDPPAETTGHRYIALPGGPAIEPTDDDGDRHDVGMRLPEPRGARKQSSDTATVAALDATEIANRLAGDAAETTFGGGRSANNLLGGAPGWATIPAGHYRTHDAGSAWGVGRGNGTARQHVAGLPTVHLCGRPDRKPSSHSCIKAMGELDKAIIRRYVQRQVDRLQYCYEKALLKDPKLSGTVETAFLIGPDGAVESALATGVSSEVSDCVADVVRAIQFPAAKNGGATQVHYPFAFRSA